MGVPPREGNILKVFENNVLGRICIKDSNTNMDKVHEHELHSSADNTNGDQISEGPVASMWEVRSVHDSVVMNLQNRGILGCIRANTRIMIVTLEKQHLRIWAGLQ
jgi:hypothetical protein